MYINRQTKRAAWLLSQDGDGVTYSDESDRRHSCSAFEFFDAHREATADELESARSPAKAAKGAKAAAAPAKAKGKPARAARKPKGGDSAPPSQSQPMQQPQASTAAPGAPTPTVRVEPI